MFPMSHAVQGSLLTSHLQAQSPSATPTPALAATSPAGPARSQPGEIGTFLSSARRGCK